MKESLPRYICKWVALFLLPLVLMGVAQLGGQGPQQNPGSVLLTSGTFTAVAAVTGVKIFATAAQMANIESLVVLVEEMAPDSDIGNDDQVPQIRFIRDTDGIIAAANYTLLLDAICEDNTAFTQAVAGTASPHLYADNGNSGYYGWSDAAASPGSLYLTITNLSAGPVAQGQVTWTSGGDACTGAIIGRLAVTYPATPVSKVSGVNITFPGATVQWSGTYSLWGSP